MAIEKKRKYPSPGDVLWEGGYLDHDSVIPAAVPSTLPGGLSPLVVILDTTKDTWQATAQLTWGSDGTVVFEEGDRVLVETWAATLRGARKIGPLYANDMPEIGKPGLRAEGNTSSAGSSQNLK
jgi:hypothetical protein